MDTFGFKSWPTHPVLFLWFFVLLFISSKLKVDHGSYIHIDIYDIDTFVTLCFYLLYIWAVRWVCDINIFLAVEGFHKKLQYLSGE